MPGDLLQKDGSTTEDHGDFTVTFDRSNKDWGWTIIIAGYVKYFPKGFVIINNREVKKNEGKSDLKFDCTKYEMIFGEISGRYLKACKVNGGFEHLPKINKIKALKDMEKLVLTFQGDNTGGTPFTALIHSETDD